LQQARNLVLVGRKGLGKTLIAKNICHEAVLAGHSVLFRTAPAILEDLQSESIEGRRRKLRGYANVGLLCIDEIGYLSYDDKAADILFEVINRRYERKSQIVTTNRIFKEWNEVFPNATVKIRSTGTIGQVSHDAFVRGHGNWAVLVLHSRGESGATATFRGIQVDCVQAA
jgi:DNA replication protein DnaC